MRDLRPRELALKALYQIDVEKAYSNLILQKLLRNFGGSELDRAFITELVYGSVRWKYTLDWVINRFTSKPLKKTDPWTRNILRLGVYQLMFLNRVPSFAACNESVELSKRYNKKAAGFVNGVLRNIARHTDKIDYPSREKTPVKHLAVKHSFQPWMIRRWIKRYGFAFTDELCGALNTRPDFCIRVNSLKINKPALKKLLIEQGYELKESLFIPEALYINNPGDIEKNEYYLKGYFQPQDEGSMLVAHVLNPKPGDVVVDVCSAPGGKTTHIAQLMNNKGTIISRDIHPHKIKLVENICRRMGITIVKAEVFDGLKTDERLVSRADRVLVDVPCSGFGIINRKPDIKWKKAPDDIQQLSGIQFKLLENASKYVKPGGILVYSTCTLEPEENQDVIASFLEQYSNFELLIDYPVCMKDLRVVGEKGFIQTYPNKHRIDGFFISKMVRRV